MATACGLVVVFRPVWVVLKVQNGGGTNREKMPSNDLQRIIGLIVAGYGFFVAVYPQDYVLKYFPNLTTVETNALSVVLLLVGVFLILTDRRLIRWK